MALKSALSAPTTDLLDSGGPFGGTGGTFAGTGGKEANWSQTASLTTCKPSTASTGLFRSSVTRTESSMRSPGKNFASDESWSTCSRAANFPDSLSASAKSTAELSGELADNLENASGTC